MINNRLIYINRLWKNTKPAITAASTADNYISPLNDFISYVYKGVEHGFYSPLTGEIRYMLELYDRYIYNKEEFTL